MRNQVIVSCGATHHMFNSPKFFPNSFEEIESEVSTGDSQSNLLAHGIGNAELKCNGQTLNLKNCLFAPKLKCNLISMLELFKDQPTIKQTNNFFFLSSKGEILLEGEIGNRLMYITYYLPNALLTLVDGNLWHCRLGHPGRAVLKNLGLPDQDCSCLTCKTNKSSKLPLNHHFEPVSLPLDTRTQRLCQRANRTVMEKAHCLMNHSNLPNQYWAEAVNTAVFLSNLSPTPSRENKSPHFLWTNTSAKLTKLQTFRCQAVIHSLKRQRDWKLAPPCQKGVLLGFENGGTGSPLWNIKDEQTNKDSSLLTSDSPSADRGYNQYPDCLENVTTEDSADPTSALNSPLPDSNPSNPEEPSSQQHSGDNCRTPQIKVIGPHHPTLITSDVDFIHILPYSTRERMFITTSNSAPRTY
ncbi:hypothetical protein O181_101465 [Austropuccinia psidii MF-1]|uniref:Retrovirus-related Pol polyprotein from transposon TNT 1-94-like beta-barrel domain-containing protein n=1 Tax=Austropuccinia psidii MF-1 TaxID=1389203 RepID=A0A9Q3JEH8_9BASI|nr:hypothetical protein [Austropuccinia psidii MF-1]